MVHLLNLIRQRKYYIYSILKGMIFHIPVLMVFLNGKFSPFEVSILLSVKTALTLLFDIPLGIVADRMGYLKALRVSFPITCASILLLVNADSFFWVLVSQVIFCIAESLESGTWFAWLKTHSNGHNSDEISRFIAQNTSCFSWSLMCAFVLGGVLFSIDKQLPFILSTLSLVILTLFLFFSEKKAHKSTIINKPVTPSSDHFWSILKYSIPISYTEGLIYGFYIYIFPYLFYKLSDNYSLLGLLFSFAILAYGQGAKFGHRIKNKYTFSTITLLIIFLLMIILISLNLNVMMLIVVVFVLRFFWGGAAHNNRLLIEGMSSPSNIVKNQSIYSTLKFSISSIVTILCGLLFENHSIPHTLLIFSFTAFVLGCTIFATLKKVDCRL